MSKAIAILESIGQDAQLHHADSAGLEAALLNAGIAPEISSAILGNDRERLEALLEAPAIICCMVFPEKKEDEEEDEPSKEDEEVSMSLAPSRHEVLAG